MRCISCGSQHGKAGGCLSRMAREDGEDFGGNERTGSWDRLSACSVCFSSRTEPEFDGLQSRVRARRKGWKRGAFCHIHVKGNEGEMCVDRDEGTRMGRASNGRVQTDAGVGGRVDGEWDEGV